MRLDLDAKVRARDGEEIGSVDRAIVNPQTNEVTDIVVRRTGETQSRSGPRIAVHSNTHRLMGSEAAFQSLPRALPLPASNPITLPEAHEFG